MIGRAESFAGLVLLPYEVDKLGLASGVRTCRGLVQWPTLGLEAENRSESHFALFSAREPVWSPACAC